MIRAAIIGCGHRAPAHIDAYQYMEDAEVVACCAPTPKRREPLAAQYKLKAYADAKDMIRAEKPDMVHIVTWPDVRLELMELVSELGVPLCTVEKPVATGVLDWRRLQDLLRETQTRFAVCHQVRWQRYLMRCQQAVLSGQIGNVRFLDLSAGMNISGQGTHTLNYGRSLVGDPFVKSVFGTVCGWDDRDPGHPAPAASEAFLTFENGLRALWTSGPVSPRCGDPNTVWQHVRVAAYGDAGLAEFQEFAKWEIVTSDKRETGDYGGMDEWRTNNIRAQAGFHQAMLDWLRDEKREPGTSLRHSLHEWAVILALYQSALERRPIEMATFDPPADLVARVRQG